MSFEEVFKYSFRCYVNFEHKSVRLKILKDSNIGYNETPIIPTKAQYQQCKYEPSYDEMQPCLYYAKDKQGLNFAIDKFATYKKPDYSTKEGYKQSSLLYKMIANKKKSLFFASLPNLYSPIKGVIEKLITHDEGNDNIFVDTLTIKDELNYRHIFRYFYANLYPKIDNKSPLYEGASVEIGDYLGFLAYDDSIIDDETHKELGLEQNLFFKYIICDEFNNFLNPITFWQWDSIRRYEVFNAQTNTPESELFYYLDKNGEIIEVAYKKGDSKHFERFFPSLQNHRDFRDFAYTHHYNALSQDIYPYKLLHNGDFVKIDSTDYPLINDKEKGVIGLSLNPSDDEITLDCVFSVSNEVLKNGIVYIYNTDSNQIYQIPQTDSKGEVRFSIKSENPHSNTLLYFSLNLDDFFDNHFAHCRSYQIMPSQKAQNQANISLNLRPTRQERHIFKLKDSTHTTTANQWDKSQRRDSIISVVNRGGKELFRLKDINNLHLITPDSITAIKLFQINDIQWFSKNANNYYEILPTSDLSTQEQCKDLKIHYDTWESLGSFIESISPSQQDTQKDSSFMRYASIYASNGRGDWKKGKNFITAINGEAFWSDAIGQLPFAINVYRGFLALLRHDDTLSDDEIRAKAKNATINLGYAFSDGGLEGISNVFKKDFATLIEFHSSLYNKEQNPPLDYNSYDNKMILRGIAWVDRYNSKEHYDKLANELESMSPPKKATKIANNANEASEIPPNTIRIETQDNSGDFIEIILPEESMLDNAINIADKVGIIPLPAFKFFKLPKYARSAYRLAKSKSRSLTREEVLEIVDRLEKNVSDSRRRIVSSKKELDKLWERLTKNAKELEPKADIKFGKPIYRRELNDRTIIQYKKDSKSGGETIEINSQSPRQNLRSIHIKP